MAYYRTVIATTDPEEGEGLRKALEDSCQFQIVDVVDSGLACVRSVVTNHAELVVMALMLRDIDGVEVLNRLDGLLSARPKTLVIACGSQAQGQLATAAGASYCMLTPYSYSAVVKRAVQLLQPVRDTFTSDEIDWKVYCVCQEINAPIHMVGFRQLREAVILAVQRPQLLSRRQLSRVLYPAVAERCDSDKDRIERNLRNFIGGLYAHGDLEGMARYHLDTLDRSKSGKPSNATFLCAMVEQVRFALKGKGQKGEGKGPFQNAYIPRD